MKFVIQRVSRASVSVDGAVIGKINKGFLVLIGIGAEDGKKEADLLVRKMCGLRIFEDQDGKTNLALKDVDGELLLISQFTLYANCKKATKSPCAVCSAGACVSRVYLKTPNAPGRRTFSRCAAPFFLEIRQYSCEKMDCSAQKFLAAGHFASFQIRP